VTLLDGDKACMGGRFVVDGEVGRGGAGVVYRAHDLVSNQPVALKVIAAEAGFAPEEEKRLAREGQLLSNLDHPGIVKTVAYGLLEDTGLPFVAMEWLSGEDVAARQRRDPLSLRQAVELTAQVAGALDAAHSAGVIHRDIKPSNIFLCRADLGQDAPTEYRPKLVDFGVAVSESISISQSGDYVGTPAYMAPEQARADAPIDARCDIYSLGATLYELVAGRPPHVGPTAIATLARLVTTPAPRLLDLRLDTPRALDALVGRLLETDPERRPASARELVIALGGILEEIDEQSVPDRPSGMLQSVRLGSSANRLLTSMVALGFTKAGARNRALDHLRQRGADAVPLGRDALVAHLGARRAVGSEASAALGLGRRLARAGARVGISTGRARVNLSDRTGEVRPVGEVVDRASALARDARPGVVLADATTSELGRGQHEFRVRDDGSTIVGDAVRGVRAEGAGGAPLVGRGPELAQVMNAFERSLADRTPILVSISGPPGIGKTRLRREVLQRISPHASTPRIVVQQSEAYGRAHALGAAAELLRAIIGLPKDITAREADSAIVAHLGPATRDELTASNRNLLARLLSNEPLPEGFDPRGSRDALWLAMTDVVVQLVANIPTVLIVEDAQWADPESVGWLDHLLGRAAHLPLLVLAMVRPAFWSDHPQRFSGRDHVRIELRRLSQSASRDIARALLGNDAPQEVVDQIAQQAAGLPLFAEELARLAAAGADTTHAPTIEAAIQVSLDSLDDECRDAVGRLSVLGVRCWDAALEALGIAHAESVMRALAGAEVLIEQDGSRFSGTAEWMFKHPLVREVAYASLDDSARKELHALAAKWLESMGEDAATVARQYDLGGAHEDAARHWFKAAKRALAANALNDAVIMAEQSLAFASNPVEGFQRASCLDEAWSRLDPRASERESAILALNENIHDEATAIRARGARARFDDARGGGEDVTDRLLTIRGEAADLGLHDEEARCSAVLAARLAFAGRFDDAKAEAARLLEFAESRGITAAAVDAWQTLAIIRQTQGALSAALTARRNAAQAAQRAGLKEREAMLTTNVGFALTTIGARQEARAALETGLSVADAIGSQGAVRHAQMNLLGWAATFGNDKRLEGLLAEPRAAADAAATSFWAAPDRANLGVLFYRGWELLRAGPARLDRARTLLKITADGYRAMGHQDVLPVALGVWAEAERRAGEPHRALELAREAAGLLEHGSPSLLNESTVYLALHDAHVELGATERARDAVVRALPSLQRRVEGLVGTPYARLFLTELPHNVGLLAAAEGYGLVPFKIQQILERGQQ